MMPTPWMQFMLWASNRRCSQCGHEFCRWLGMMSMRHANAKRMCLAFWFTFIALAIVGTGAFFAT